jgi:hypothetical protein
MIFHVWIVAESSFDESLLISTFVNRGYDISAASEDNKLLLTSKDTGNVIFACKIEKPNMETSREVYNELYEVLGIAKVNYFAVIISEHSHNAIWNVGMAGQKQQKQELNFRIN